MDSLISANFYNFRGFIRFGGFFFVLAGFKDGRFDYFGGFIEILKPGENPRVHRSRQIFANDMTFQTLQFQHNFSNIAKFSNLHVQRATNERPPSSPSMCFSIRRSKKENIVFFYTYFSNI